MKTMRQCLEIVQDRFFPRMLQTTSLKSLAHAAYPINL